MATPDRPTNEKISFFRARIKSFGFALAGLKILLKSQPNARIHLLLAIIAISLGFIFRISTGEWCIIVLLIGFVFAAEIFNTAIEWLCDYVQPNYDEKIKVIKDLGAAAVLTASISATLIGCLIFIPKLYHLILKLLD